MPSFSLMLHFLLLLVVAAVAAELPARTLYTTLQSARKAGRGGAGWRYNETEFGVQSYQAGTAATPAA